MTRRDLRYFGCHSGELRLGTGRFRRLSPEAGNTGLWGEGPKLLLRSLCNVAGEGRAYVVEGSVDAACKSLHASRASKGDQSEDECIFHQILARLFRQQSLQPQDKQ